MRNRFAFWLLFLALQAQAVVNNMNDESLKLHYTFADSKSGVMDQSGNGFTGTLKNGATLKKVGSFDVLDLGNLNGYLDMGANVGDLVTTLTDFSVATYCFIDPSANISGNGNFIWTFSTLEACSQTAGKYIALRLNAQRYALSTGGWGSERVAIQKGSNATKGSWQHLVYTQTGGVGTLYLNGAVLVSGSAALAPKELGTSTPFNWIGRPQFAGDAYLTKSMLADFRIYNKALTSDEVVGLASNISLLNEALSSQKVYDAASALDLGDLTQVKSDLVLPQLSNSVTIKWLSSNTGVISTKGVVTRPAFGTLAAKVTLTARLSNGAVETTKDFVATVVPYLSNKQSVEADLKAILFTQNLNLLRVNLPLPATGIEGAQFAWTSNQLSIFSNSGELLAFPKKGEGQATVILTVIATKGGETASRDIQVRIPEDEGYSAYLFAYFTGNSGNQEAIRFALSPDGYQYRALNGDQPVIGSDSISDMKGVRDPHILRSDDGKWFYMVVTDMKSDLGWNSNHGMVLLKSSDLVNWTHSRIDIQTVFPNFLTVNRVWAPQTVYDPAVKKYLVYWSMRSGDAADVIYYSYATADFTALVTEPQVLFHSPTNSACIDGDIVLKEGVYNLFFKTEGNGNGIKKAVSDNVTGPYTLIDQTLNQTTDAVEGSCVYRLINSDTYILMYDVYSKGKYEFTSSTDLTNFKVLDNVSMNFSARHGTTISISKEEAELLAAKWAAKTDILILSSEAKEAKKLNVEISNSAVSRKVYLPLKRGADLTQFDPKLVSMPGVVITPQGPQDFSKGAVAYQLTLREITYTYSVTASVDNNPIVEGYYADPEILYSEKTKKFYLYPTSDGFLGWSGTYFKTFSSDNMVDWKEENVIIDLAKGDVGWASTNAWAPCIIEKKVADDYKFYYYFTAAQKIGVAVADNPTGPFVDSGKALVSSFPVGITGGQQIDPDVFMDPVSGKSYLYWGNGYMAGAELSDDMVSIKTETTKVMTPNSTFREGAYVFFRKGVYYFCWSEDDTGSQNYKVRYGTSDSPLGKITVPANNLVIAKDAAQGIYGTGHNSIIQIPNTDEWYIVYHRFTRPKGITISNPGNFRETCIDKMMFNEDGSIKQVVPTLQGIAPVVVPEKPSALPLTFMNQNPIQLYPNPVKSILNFDWIGQSNQPLELKISNMVGAIVLEKRVSPEMKQIDCSRLAAGVYLLHAQQGDTCKEAKFIKL